MLRRPPRSTLFPTRRSSDLAAHCPPGRALPPGAVARRAQGCLCHARHRQRPARTASWSVGAAGRSGGARSEEHTSELQSRRDLVCRLLLEKKKKKKKNGREH